MKGQTSIAAIVIAVILVIFLMIFLFATTISQQIGSDYRDEYRNLYVTNMLLSLLNTDTECEKFSDMVKDRYFGGAICTEEEIVYKLGSHINDTLKATGNTNYRWLLEVEPKFQGSFITQWGDSSVTDEDGYWDARTFLSSGPYRLEVKLYIIAD
ncbi:MAG: hypothetical protein JSV63_04385 [Candidatus Aenigmatarchaeota archaeon]|nr:MAG: hypothetical protein JSV63_04385 [Candidatus Aenigmarchaeota archaeon]